MTTITTDVNAQFAAERASQLEQARASQAAWDQRVKDGKLVSLGNGRFRVNDPGSWDNGEVLIQAGGQILPQHQLDMSTGRAALYTAVPAWHQLGNVVPGGTNDVDEVLKLGGISFGVETRNVRFHAGGKLQEVPSQFVTVRDDTWAPLGVVGRYYTVIQNRDAFSFLQDLVDSHNVTWESAGALGSGEKVFISMRLPDPVTIDAGGISDQIIPFLVAVNTHDGSGKFRVVVTPWRPVCGNTERFALRDAVATWGVRHTRSATEKIEEARRTLGLSVKYFETFAAEETRLAQTALELDAFDQLLADLWPAKPEEEAKVPSKRQATIDAHRREALHTLFAAESDITGRTCYAGERAVTQYLDHVARRNTGGKISMAAARATAIIEGDHDQLKSKAHKQLLARTR
jgi:phage/plasmid-like protein (TIGR03299 family)